MANTLATAVTPPIAVTPATTVTLITAMLPKTTVTPEAGGSQQQVLSFAFTQYELKLIPRIRYKRYCRISFYKWAKKTRSKLLYLSITI
jgi:hypothetical protein